MSKSLKFVSAAIMACCFLYGCQKQPGDTATTTVDSSKVVPHATSTVSPKTYDGPFGLSGALPIAELQRLKFKPVASHPGIFTGPAPRPVDGINEYVVLATPKAGVCRVQARANVSVANLTGDQIKQKVDQLAEVMAVKYGPHSNKTDLVNQDVYRRNPQYWMMALAEDSVTYSYGWSAGQTKQPLPADLDNIEISAGAGSTSSGWAAIQYTFKNFDACLKEEQQRKAANL